ncbi:uncharacterized protein LOC128545948 [Mercenaria mercenaria]|uniref:uncharacterized protein LOC128545948 n=1 Tax=Mercenaria mercenaria TaxID=6596 RepID=UPI00234E8246|nr:uncharacterized protein LOC128545948 [Mercenaria mercenaria]XP_045168676.2 uncharacterized protein LOC128545948 [Mercenaria mercenaria]XP_045168677.2 uncharacterized protein LOC128545948 [Mercenaria mercenaria]
MPEGSGGIVRAEFQGDTVSDSIDSSERCCIMFSRVDVARHCDDYNSSGGSDSENDAMAWDRSPRSGHPRRRFHAHADQHGSQRGLQSVKRIQQVQHESQVTTNEEKKKQHASLPTKNKPKIQRNRTKSCSNNKSKSDKQIDSNKENEEVEMQLAKSDFGKENGLEKVNLVDEPKGLERKDFKNLLDLEMSTGITQKEVEYAAEPRDMVEIFKDGKEYYEKEVEMFYKIKTLITDEEKVTDEEKKFTETVIVDDSKMEKDRKDSFNVQQSLKMPSSKNFKIEKDQTDMFEKQKMKKEDVRTFEKRDKEKEVTAEESYNGSTLNMKTKGQKGEQSERAKEKHKGKSIKIDEIFDAGRHGQKEKLVVNMEQGKLGQRNSSTWYQEVDNKVLDAMERKDKEEKEQTVLKEVRDPQVGNETEKQDISKEASLGFEVDGNCAEFEEPESNSNLQNADKIWQKRQRELERCTSVDESSFSFSVEYHSTELQSSLLSSSYSRSLESKDLSDINHSCPDLYRIAVVQDSNQIRDHLDNIFWDPEALCEHNKNRIIETINTKSGKEEYFEGNEEKFRKEIIDKTERTEDKNDIDNGESEEDEADISLVNTADDDADDNDNDDDDDSNIESEAVDTAKVCITKEDSDFVDCVQTADEKRLADDINQNGNDDEPLEIIDADEKDEVEKEKVEVFEVKTVDVEEKGRRAERPDTSVMEKILDMQGTKDTPSIPLMKTGYSVSDYTDNETIKTRHLRMCPYTRKYKKENKTDKKHERKKLPNKKLDIWMKMKKNPVVKLPEQKETDRLAPKRNWDGRRYSMFGCGEFGRKCSANGGRGGSFEGDPSSSRNQRNNEDKNSKNRRNQNNKDRDSEDKNNNNPGQNNPSVSTDTETENAVRAEPTRGIVDVSTPDDDFKRYKKKDTDTDGKKHTNLENFDWLDRTTAEIEENKGPTVNLFDRLSRGECQCVEERLDNPQELSEDALQCSICITVDSLLKHYAHCTSVFNSCDMCVKIFSLLCSHVAACIKDNSVALCEIRICKTMKIAAENNIGMHMKTLWFQVRKKLARILDDGEEDIVQQQTPVDEPKPRRPSKGLSSFSGPLPSIPEGTQLSLTSSSRSSSRVLHRKKSNLANVEEQEKSVSSEEGSSWGAAVVEAAGAQGVEEIDDESSEAVDSKHGLENASTKISYSRPEIPDEADAIPTSSEEGSEESTGSVSTEGSGQFGIITGAGRYRSLPMGPPGQGEPYFPSFKDRPTGKKGIGEVVYANKHQLVVVVTIWEKFKIQYLIEAKLAKHYTEEGVILPEFKSKLRIKGLRYQNEFQWVKVAHLGNGMTGKCHLATDFETDFKFCVKEIHISNYEKEEIELWSELEHPYVVQVYGAIRHGEKIYILQEFIEGGCLTEAINVQRKLSRRLSQLTALRYFQQLLEVLKYLKSRNILHEDLKADNILLNKNSDPVTIKVADFGLARRCQGSVRSGTKPVGTQTQWSPEKAEARVGYGFAAEVWASICVLVHMLSGQPPWVRRYESFKALIVVIVEKSPPMEDIPRNIHESIKDLIKRGFTVCQGQRPTAEQLLEHGAFRLLDEAAALQSMNGTYSILESLHFESQTNQIDYDPNADLREIFRNLERDRAQGAAANNGTRRKDKKGSVVSVYNEEVPYYSNEYRVYTSGLGEGDGKKNVNSQLSLRQATEYSNKALQGTEHQKNGAGSSDSVDIYARSRLPSHPDNNIDPTTHINKFFNDIGPAIPANVQPNLVIYHPSLESIGSQKGNSGSQHSSLENLSSGTVTNKLIPDFGKIGMLPDPGEGFDSGSSEEENEDDVLKNFDFKKAVEHVGEQYTLPTVLNSSVDMSPGSQFTSAHSSSLPTEKDNDVPKVDNQERNTVQTKPETTVPAYSEMIIYKVLMKMICSNPDLLLDWLV